MRFFYFVLLALVFSSCATMFNSGTQSTRVIVDDEHEGVKVEVSSSKGSYSAKLPTTIVASPSTFKGLQVKVIDKCYQQTTHEIGKGITPSYWANLLNIWGFIIDPLTGSMWRYNDIERLVLSKKEGCK